LLLMMRHTAPFCSRYRAMSQGLTLVYVRTQLEQLQDTFMSKVGSYGGQKSSS
jgi:hypothetical protein